MPQSEKITRRLDLDKRAEIKGVRILAKAVNYDVDRYVDSGSYLGANNSSQVVYFNLPPVNAVNGYYWNFFAMNSGKFQIVGDTNVVVSDYGVVQKAVNFGHGREGEGARIISDGTKYYVVGVNPFASSIQANVGYLDG